MEEEWPFKFTRAQVDATLASMVEQGLLIKKKNGRYVATAKGRIYEKHFNDGCAGSS
jgi:hypothetical protein